MVNDLKIADVVEDTIELYLLDTTLRRRLVEGTKKSGRVSSEEARKVLEEMSDFEEARTLRPYEVPSHGHFTNWRKAFEEH